MKGACKVHLDLPPKRHWRLMSGWCDVGKMAFENLPPRSASLISNACLLNAVRHSDGEEVSGSRVVGNRQVAKICDNLSSRWRMRWVAQGRTCHWCCLASVTLRTGWRCGVSMQFSLTSVGYRAHWRWRVVCPMRTGCLLPLTLN